MKTVMYGLLVGTTYLFITQSGLYFLQSAAAVQQCECNLTELLFVVCKNIAVNSDNYG